MLPRDDQTYLAGVIERAKALGEVFDGNGGNSDKAREELAGFIGQPGRLLDLLRRCDRLYGLGDPTHRRLDWIGGEWERGPQGYPAIWDSLANDEVLADLERCLEQAGKTETAQDLQNLVLRDFDRTVFEEIAGSTTACTLDYLCKRLPARRKDADHPDPKTVRAALRKLKAKGLVKHEGDAGWVPTSKGCEFERVQNRDQP